ncbi:trypsin-1-like isoform X2 [Chelonus insularis]|uniref:trypsin-1-like isoform X2 n=1 Tax=Chelonus insularis TaxID=460826 RepID=UPI00158E44E9|nr:trypsin-1-like isoform X2 [Chelonus insularis]
MLILYLSLRRNDKHICGATIISSNWGITAAHCVLLPVSTANYSVRAGSNYRSQGGSVHKLVNVIHHPQYNSSISDYDAGLFMVEPEFQFDNSTQPIVLPASDEEEKTDTSWGTAVGWGAYQIDDEENLSETLKGATLPKFDWNECEDAYYPIFPVTKNEVCYGFKNGTLDTCKGDSGGPLFSKDKIFIGITSWGDECAESGSPGVYTSIPVIRNWIKNVTGV